MSIRLADLRRAVGMDAATANRWAASGLFPSTNTGRGAGHGYSVTRAAAFEFLALALLRRSSASLQELRRIARRMRQEGRSGPAFLALGADGRTALLDGTGDDAPLRDPDTGQGRLFVALDLRRLRADIEQLVNELAEAAA